MTRVRLLSRAFKATPAIAAMLVLIGCDAGGPPRLVSSPAPRAMAQPAAVPPETAQSAAARAYYAQVQQVLLSQGLLRSDGGGVDTPVTDRAELSRWLTLFDKRDAGAFDVNASNRLFGATLHPSPA